MAIPALIVEHFDLIIHNLTIRSCMINLTSIYSYIYGVLISIYRYIERTNLPLLFYASVYIYV